MASRETYNFVNVVGANTLVKTGPGKLHTVIVNQTDTKATVIYDGVDTAGTKIASIDVSPTIGSKFVYDVEFSKGLFITTSGLVDLTVSVGV